MTQYFGFVFYTEIQRPTLSPFESSFTMMYYKDGVVLWKLPKVLEYLSYLIQQSESLNEVTVKVNKFVIDFLVTIGEDVTDVIDDIDLYMAD